MSSDSPGSETSVEADGEAGAGTGAGTGIGGRLVEESRETLRRTRLAAATALRRRDGLAVLGAVTAGYLLAYLFAIGHLAVGPSDGFDLFVVRDPLSLLFQRTGPLQFEAVARLIVGPVTLLIAPVSVAVGLALAGLVGLNLALSYLAWRQPAACGIAAGAGPLAALPGLFSGAACCGPAVLAVVGIQASAALLTAFSVLIPVAGLALVTSLLWVGRRVDPELLAAADADAGAGASAGAG